MPEKDPEQEEQEGAEPESSKESPDARPARRRIFTRRNALIVVAGATLVAILLALFVTVSYRYGVFDTYIKTQFVTKMAEIGIVFDADVFRVTASPFEIELQNATFNNRITGEKLMFVRNARIGLSIDNLFAWELSRDIRVETTDIYGAEVWVTFDENGRSNFSDLVYETTESRINFRYESVRFALRDSVVHYGDVSRRLSGDANNVQLFIEPENYDVPDEEKRYKIDLTSTDSRFVYDGSPLDEIDIRIQGVADRLGADITHVRIDTPVGYSQLTGRLTDWSALTYELNIESSVDLTQTSNIFPLGATLRGVGNFLGKISGSGENYRVEGEINSDALAADGIYLKAVNVAATVEGTNSNYTANGTAVAELLTFEDFRIEFPKLTGNVRGTGTDFRWVGELQAAAAKTESLTLGGLFLSDAVAEYRDRELTMAAANGRAGQFSIADTEFADLVARDLRITNANGVTRILAPGATAAEMKTPDYRLQGLTGRNLRVANEGETTTVEMDNLTADAGRLKENTGRGLRADSLTLTSREDRTDIELANIRADTVNAPGTTITGVTAPSVTISDDPVYTRINADSVLVARIEGGGAILGSLNIAGVRLTIREGRVEGSSNDIDAGEVTLVKSSSLTEGGRLDDVKILKPIFVVEPSAVIGQAPI
jgi:hypothetical protein